MSTPSTGVEMGAPSENRPVVETSEAIRMHSVKLENQSLPSKPSSNVCRSITTFGIKERADVCIVVVKGQNTKSFELNAGVLASTSQEWDKILPFPSTDSSQLSVLPRVVLPAVDPAAMEVILHAAHFEYDKVPLKAPLELLYQMASSLSSFEMGPIVAKFAPGWLSGIRQMIRSPIFFTPPPQATTRSKKRKISRLRSEASGKPSTHGSDGFSSPTRESSWSGHLHDADSESTAVEREVPDRQNTDIAGCAPKQAINITNIVSDSDRVILIAWELGDSELFLCAARTIINDSFVGNQGEIIGPSDVVLTNHMYNSRMMHMIDQIIQTREDIIYMAFKNLLEMQKKLFNGSSCTVEDSSPTGREYCAVVVLGGFRQFLYKHPDLDCLEDPSKYKGTVRDLVDKLKEGGSVRVRSRHADCNIFAEVAAQIADFHLDAMRNVGLSADHIKHMSLRSSNN